MTLKEMRKERKYTQDTLAEIVGCSRITIVRMEAGRIPVTLKIMEGLSRAFEIPINEVIELLKQTEDDGK